MDILDNIHDPGLTPGGILNAGEFCRVYPFLRKPEIIVTSHLRRSLQTALIVRDSLYSSGIITKTIRIVANPDLQGESIWPSDTGSPLEILRKQFPTVEFPDELFPDIYPRQANIRPEKKGTIYDDEPDLLATRAKRFRNYLQGVSEQEVIVVTHGSFARYLINFWEGEPGRSFCGSIELMHGNAQPYIMPQDPSSNAELTPFVPYLGTTFSNEGELKDCDPYVYAYMPRDCGIFTDEKIANAIGRYDPD